MIETLLAIVACELGFICAVGAAIFGIEMFSLWLRYRAIKDEAKMTRIHATPEQIRSLFGVEGATKGTGLDKPVEDVVKVAQGQYL